MMTVALSLPFLILALCNKQSIKQTLLSIPSTFCVPIIFLVFPIVPLYPVLLILSICNTIHIRTFNTPLQWRALKLIKNLPSLKDSIFNQAPLITLFSCSLFAIFYSCFLTPPSSLSLLSLPFLLLSPKKLLPYPFQIVTQCYQPKVIGQAGEIPNSQNEVAYKYNNEFPLEKYTVGFSGKKVFSIPHKKKPHVVFFYLESFRSTDVGKITPHFDKWSKRGIFFSKFYASASQTFKAMFATFYGLPPCFGIDFVESTSPVLTLPLKGLPNFFKENGYTNIFIKAGSHNFDNQGDFLKNHHFHEMYDEMDVKRQNPEAYGTSWGVHDEFMYDFMINRIQTSKTPLFINTASVTNHHPFVTPESFTPFFGKTPFEIAMEYSDHTLGLALEKLSCLEIPMHVYIMGDHGYPLNHSGRPGLSPTLDEHVTHVPLLILPLHCGEVIPKEIKEVSSQIDILPTIMDLYGFTGKNSGIGSSLCRKRETPTAYLLNESLEPMSGLVTSDSYQVFNEYIPIYNTLKTLYKQKKISSEVDALKVLNLSSQCIAFKELQLLLAINPNLETLQLDNCPIIAGLDFNYPKSLRKISLENNVLILDEDIKHLPNTIESISILGCRNLTDQSLQYLKHLPLKEISLSCKPFSNKALFHFLSSLTLDKIWLKDAEHLNEEFFHVFSSHPLTEITISGARSLSDRSIKSISSPMLKVFMSDNCSNLTDLALCHLKKCPLELLHLERATHISDEGISQLQFLKIHTFFISHNHHITENGVKNINTNFMRNLFCIDCLKMPEVYTDTPEKQIYFLSNQGQL